ncbi:uncharacterized protein LOC114518209 isoform X2 [Dendronephthya gigantea]|nr:uncharacterized protein LOC114518209 isoform X2 [Dendronephthya gigantea]
MHLTEKLVGVQSDLEDAKTNLTSLTKQIEVKEADIDRLKGQVNVNKAFEKECSDLRKGLQAKEQQLQTYRSELDQMELSHSQAEVKYDEYVEMCRNLKVENQHLKDDIEARSQEQEKTIIEIRKDLEAKHDKEMNELKDSQEKEITQLKEIHEDEVLGLKEKLDAIRRRSLATATTSAPALLPESRDSARFSTDSELVASRALSTWKSSARTSRTIVEVKTSESGRLDTASSEWSDTKGKDSVLERSSSIFVSMSDTPVPQTPKTAETLRPSGSSRSRDTSPLRNTTESSTQTDDVIGERSEVTSRHDLLEIEREMVKTPTDELPQKMDEYRNKFAEIEQQLQDEVFQWKLKFNTKAQALNELMLTQENQLKERDELMEQLSTAQEQKAAAEEEAEKAILQLEELRAEKEGSSHVDEDDVRSNLEAVQTEDKETATSASLYRMQNIMDAEKTPQTSVGIQCTSAQVSRKPSMRSPQYSDVADEQEMLLFGGLNASDSGFGGSSNVLHPDDVGTLQNEVDPSKFRFHPRSPSSVASSGRVRSRLVRSALRDHRVIVETVRTYEMITQFKMDITIWLQEHGLGHKSKLLTAIPDLTLDKEDELDVLSNMSAIRDTTQQILDALWQTTKDDYSWSQHDLVDGNDKEEEGGEDVVHHRDVGIVMDTENDFALPTSEVAEQDGNVDDKDQNDQSQNRDLRDRSVQTSRRRAPRPTPTTPKGYTRLLHEYNNLQEEYNTLTQQIQDNVKSYQEQISENATVMNEMQETINGLRSQMIDGNAGGRISPQPLISSLMFTRLDAERNVKSMKRAVLTQRLSQNSYNSVIQEMDQYVSLPGRRLAELVKRYRHHCTMKDVEENLNPVRMTSAEVYNLQERMEYLQRKRALKWSEKMAELGRQRSELGDKISSSLKEIEESSGIFLIKPVYSYVSKPSAVEKSSHPVICKKRAPRSPEVSSSKPSYPLETTRTPGQSIARPMWISTDSHVSDSGTLFDDNPMPRLLAMDVNRFTLSKNLISGAIDVKSGTGGVRQYVTVERPIGSSKPVQNNRATKVPTPSRHMFPEDSRASSPGSFTPYPPLPPISLPHSHVSSATSATNQSDSSLSVGLFN